MVRTRAGFAVCSYGVGPRIPVRSSSRAGLLAGSKHSGIGGLPHVAGVRRENVGYHVYMAQGILERINAQRLVASVTSPSCIRFDSEAFHVLLITPKNLQNVFSYFPKYCTNSYKYE